MIMATIVMKNLRELEEGRALEQGSGILPGLRALVNRAEVMIINYMKVFGACAFLRLASANLFEKGASRGGPDEAARSQVDGKYGREIFLDTWYHGSMGSVLPFKGGKPEQQNWGLHLLCPG